MNKYRPKPGRIKSRLSNKSIISKLNIDEEIIEERKSLESDSESEKNKINSAMLSPASRRRGSRTFSSFSKSTISSKAGANRRRLRK
jgi:hypothetical protein